MKKHLSLIILAFLIMTAFGFISNIKGVVLPAIKDFYQASYGQMGLMLFIASLGFMLATFLGGMAGDRYGQKVVLIFGFLVLGVSMLLVLWANSFFIYVLIMLLTNTGLGCIEIGVNALGAKIFTKNSAIMMNLLHLFYGIGSTIGPKYAGWMLAHDISWKKIYFYTIFLVITILIYAIISRFPAKESKDDDQKLPFKVMVKKPKVWLLVAVLGFSIVTELGLGNWLVTFLQEVRELNANTSSTYLSFFFVTFTIGRLVGGYLAEKLGYVQIIKYFSTICLFLFGSGLIIKQGIFLFSLIGFFISIMYPTIMVIIMKEFKENTSAVMGFVITAAITINMVSNWLIGKSNDLFGVFYGFGSIIIYNSLLIVFLIILEKKLNYLKQDETGQDIQD